MTWSFVHLLKMPTRILTPSRAGLIFATAVIVTVFNLMVNITELPHTTLCDTNWMNKILQGPIEQDDPVLLEWIKNKFIPPSRKVYNLEYSLSGLFEEDTLGRVKMLSPSQEFILGKIEELAEHWMLQDVKGVFLEAGAYDGEYLSNTLALEKSYGWGGILVEAHPDFFKRLQRKNRKAYSINACLNTKPYPSRETFLVASESADRQVTVNGPPDAVLDRHGNLGSSGLAGVSDLKNKSDIGSYIDVQCLPLYSIVRSLGIDKIDFLSLDVERAEMGILDTIPWDKMSFGMLAIEHRTLQDLKDFLKPKGYVHVESKQMDHVFVNKDIVNFVQIDPAGKKTDVLVDKDGKFQNMEELKKDGMFKRRKTYRKRKKYGVRKQ